MSNSSQNQAQAIHPGDLDGNSDIFLSTEREPESLSPTDALVEDQYKNFFIRAISKGMTRREVRQVLADFGFIGPDNTKLGQ